MNAAVIDCGASKTCCGSNWWNGFKSSLSESDQKKIQYSPSKRVFKFGPSKRYPSITSVCFPAFIMNRQIKINADIVQADVPLLLSRESLKLADTKINFQSDTAEMFGETVKLINTKSGHYAVPITQQTYLLNEVITTDNYQSPQLSCLVHEIFASYDSTSIRKMAEKLHRQFAHPPTDRLIKLVNSAGQPWCDNVKLKEEIRLIQPKCETCIRYK